MLEVDHSLRITAKDALNHPYLKQVVNQIDNNTNQKSSGNNIKKKAEI